MRRSIPGRLVLAVAVAIVLAANGTATAQLLPRHLGFDGWGGYPYGGVSFNPDSSFNTSRNIASQMQDDAAQRAQRQNYVVQSGIRSTLSSQAQSQSAATIARNQSNQDWFFQHREQQMAANRSQAAYRPAAYSPNATSPAASGLTPPSASGTEQAATDLIDWPPILRIPQFAAQRARVEAPFRASKAKNFEDVTVAQYEDILAAIEQMRVILNGMVNEISAADYIRGDKALESLEQDTRTRIRVLTPAAKQPAESAPDSKPASPTP